MALEVTRVLLSAQLVDSTVRKRAEESLKQFQEQNLPVFLLSLSLELACEWKPVDSRKLAGLVLKNALDSKEQHTKDELAQRWLSLDVAVKTQIKSCLLRTLSSTAAEARSTASQVIAKVACIELPQKQWPELVGYLLSNICDVPPHVKQATIETLGYLCEEVAPNVIDQDQVKMILTAFVQGMNASEGGGEVSLASTRALYNALGFIEVALRSSLLPEKESVSDEECKSMSEAESAPVEGKAETRKAECQKYNQACNKGKMKAVGKPKRPATPFVFIEDVGEMYKKKNPIDKNVSAHRKAGGEKWKSMSVAEKAPFIAKAEKRKAEQAYNKVPDKPKTPPSPFFIFREYFRKTYKEKHPDNKSVSPVGKAGGEKWKSMSEAERAPLVAKAEKRKAEYNKLLQGYNKKIREGTCAYEKSDKWKYEVNDYKDDDEDGSTDGDAVGHEDGRDDDEDEDDDGSADDVEDDYECSIIDID